MLAPIRQEPLIDTVEKNIYSYIKAEGFRPGDDFPGEQKLANMLEVSRPVVREALSRLRMLGLLDSRKRRGIIISKPTIFETMKKIIDPFFLDEEEQRDFCNLRLTIEFGLADLLLQNIKEEDISELEEIVKCEESNPADFKLYLKCDYKFHFCIYHATRCKSLESFQTLLYRFFADVKTRKAQSRDDFSDRFNDPTQQSHRDVLEAINTKDPECVQRSMRKHLSIHFKKNSRSN